MSTSTNITILDAYELFALDCRSRRLRKSTQDFYKHKILGFQRWLGERDITVLSDITSVHIKTFLLSLDERGLTSHSQHDYARAIKTFLRYSVRDELLDKTPFERVKMPRVEQTLPVILTDSDIRTCMNRIKDTRNRLIFKIILDSGARASELLALNVGDIDLETGVVTVHQGKGQKDRLTSIGTRTRKDVKRHFLQRGSVANSEPVITSQHSGKRLTLTGLMHVFRKMREETGIDHLTAHTVRRTMATRSLRNGVDAYVLAQMLGHSDLTTLRRYALVDEELIRAVGENNSVIDNL